ncbi:MAG: dTDP-D-glucose 4,6-dehydratase [Solivirus sp.]|uniref:dTDP-D-glucose 4,6-dehydratase n=1 Tax=Solivirus sp. TaxID=2487772 RepID=A0A3G5AFD6_9VIRU|nr:MAG: dTDP-D-glucose 4,6-dehydratase [Solivirus sp.]
MAETIIDLNRLDITINLPIQKFTELTLVKNNSILTIPITDANQYIIKPSRRLTKMIVHLCKVGPWFYFEDYHMALDIADVTILYNNKETLYNLEFKDPNLFFILSFDHRDNQILIPLETKNTIIINFEQLTDYGNYIVLRPLYDKGFQIVDYSYCHRHILPNEIYLPYFYNEGEINHLEELINENRGKWEHDVAAVCNGTPHRQEIEAKLKERGLKVLDVRGWREDRDKQIAKCRILLNIHAHAENFTIAEHLRMNRWMLANMKIISEESDEQDSIDMFNVEFHPFDKLVDRVVEYFGSLQPESLFRCSSAEDLTTKRQIYREKCERQLQIIIDKFNL